MFHVPYLANVNVSVTLCDNMLITKTFLHIVISCTYHGIYSQQVSHVKHRAFILLLQNLDMIKVSIIKCLETTNSIQSLVLKQPVLVIDDFEKWTLIELTSTQLACWNYLKKYTAIWPVKLKYRIRSLNKTILTAEALGLYSKSWVYIMLLYITFGSQFLKLGIILMNLKHHTCGRYFSLRSSLDDFEGRKCNLVL